MDIDLAALPDDVKMLQQMVRTLTAERTTALVVAQAEIERLRLIVQKLQRSQFGRRSERLDDDQLQFGFEDLEADLARAEAKLPSPVQTPSTSKSQMDRLRLPAELPREDRRLDIEHDACPCCGGALHAIGESITEMLDHVPARLRVIRIFAMFSNASPTAIPCAVSTTCCLGIGPHSRPPPDRTCQEWTLTQAWPAARKRGRERGSTRHSGERTTRRGSAATWISGSIVRFIVCRRRHSRTGARSSEPSRSLLDASCCIDAAGQVIGLVTP